MVKKLTKSQQELVKSWNKELALATQSISTSLQGVLQEYQRVTNEVYNLRLEKLAKEELGINIDEGDWKFDMKNSAFMRVDVPQETIPNEKKRKKKIAQTTGSKDTVQK